MLGARSGVNNSFYGKVATPTGILGGEHIKLSEGKTYTPTPEEVQEKEAAAEVAQKTSDEIAKLDRNVEKVDAIAEAEKEKASS
jgi:D-aminopeptidase